MKKILCGFFGLFILFIIISGFKDGTHGMPVAAFCAKGRVINNLAFSHPLLHHL